MEAINIRRFGMTFGFTSALLYLGCAFVMWTVGKEVSILFFNSLMHGIDVTSIIRTDMPWWEMAMGLVETFILGWLYYHLAKKEERVMLDKLGQEYEIYRRRVPIFFPRLAGWR